MSQHIVDIDEKSVPSQPAAHDPAIDINVLEAEVAKDEDVYQQRALLLGTTVEETEEDRLADKKLLRKIDLHIMPILMFTYALSVIDKATLTSAVNFKLKTDLNLVGQDYSWLSTGFNLAMFLTEFPANYVMQRFRIDRVLAFAVIWWGICVFGTAACQNFTQIMATRVLLGIGEAALNPGFLIITTAWYKKSEQHIRAMIWFFANAFFMMFFLLIFYGLGLGSHSISGWRSMYLFMGAVSVVWSFAVYFFLSTPKTARWLTKEERARAHARLVSNLGGESESGIPFNWAEVREACTDPMVWFTLVFDILYCMSSGGISAFASIILASFGLNAGQTIAYQIPWYGFQCIGMLGCGYVCHRWQKYNVNLLSCMFCCIPALVGIFLQALLDNNHRWGRIVGYWITGLFPAAIFVVWAQVALNVAGRTKKSAVQGAVFAVFAIGYMIGPQVFQTKDAPQYRPGLYFCAACYSLMFLTAIVWRFWTSWENARRDKIVAAMGLSPAAAELEGRLNALKGMTDRQNIHFRYRY